MSNLVDVGVVLPAGTYWLDWQADGSLVSGPFAPPIAQTGGTATGNGKQALPGWGDAVDSGTFAQQGFPFEGIGRTQSKATFKVYKDFNDGNPSEVAVHLDCTTGLIPDQDQNPSDGQPITFVLTDFDEAEPDCEITESVPTGYQAYYEPGGQAGNSISCQFDDVRWGDEFTCTIYNDVVPIQFDVRKLWFDEHPEFNNSTYARAKYSCAFEANLECSGRFDCNDGKGYGQQLHFDGVDSYDTFPVYPNWNGKTTCSVWERVRDSSVDSDDSDCQDVPVLLGQDVSPAAGDYECTITNTRVYEGVPTLSQYGLAIMALLMLAIGLVGFRRVAG